MTKLKHIPFVANCPCSDCSRCRKNKETLAKLEKLQEKENEQAYGPNWKNILSGMGDQ